MQDGIVMPREKIPYNMKHLLVDLVKKAQEDGYISRDEAEVIHQIQLDVRDLEKEIMNVKASNPDLLPKEWKKEALKRIIDNSVKVAMRDGKITDEEKALIDLLKEKLDTYYEVL